MPASYRLDLLVDNGVIVEVKAVDKTTPIHEPPKATPRIRRLRPDRQLRRGHLALPRDRARQLHAAAHPGVRYRRMRFSFGPVFWLVLGVVGCGGDDKGVATSCDDLCTELVFTCEYDAFPDFDSCTQGCLYSAELGGDTDGQLACVQAAACDTFAIVECEHDYGNG